MRLHCINRPCQVLGLAIHMASYGWKDRCNVVTHISLLPLTARPPNVFRQRMWTGFRFENLCVLDFDELLASRTLAHGTYNYMVSLCSMFSKGSTLSAYEHLKNFWFGRHQDVHFWVSVYDTNISFQWTIGYRYIHFLNMRPALFGFWAGVDVRTLLPINLLLYPLDDLFLAWKL